MSYKLIKANFLSEQSPVLLSQEPFLNSFLSVFLFYSSFVVTFASEVLIQKTFPEIYDVIFFHAWKQDPWQ